MTWSWFVVAQRFNGRVTGQMWQDVNRLPPLDLSRTRRTSGHPSLHVSCLHDVLLFLRLLNVRRRWVSVCVCVSERSSGLQSLIEVEGCLMYHMSTPLSYFCMCDEPAHGSINELTVFLQVPKSIKSNRTRSGQVRRISSFVQLFVARWEREKTNCASPDVTKTSKKTVGVSFANTATKGTEAVSGVVCKGCCFCIWVENWCGKSLQGYW